ncbi:hypothetical protein Hanom_Chr09g00786801 [Helianthus anomalus]
MSLLISFLLCNLSKMSNRGKGGKRGAATFSKKDCEFTVELNQLMQPIGRNANDFTSWLGVKLKAEFSYHIPSDKFGKEKWEELWLDIKRQWHIGSEAPKKFILKNAKKRHTNWRSYLTTEFVRKGLTPFETYKNLDSEHWKEFVTQRSGKEFEKKSRKARASAKANKNPTRLGRTGFAALSPRLEKIWSQLVPMYSFLKNVQDYRSKRYIVSRAKRNRKTKLYSLCASTRAESIILAVFERKMIDDGSYFSNKEDPLTRLLGPEHGGRSRTVFILITRRTQVREGLFQGGRQQHQDNMPTNQTRSYSGLDSSPNSCGENDTSGGCHIQYPLIEEPTLCELLHPSPSKREQIVGTAYLHPSPSRTIHTRPMAEGYVKIQVVEIYPLYKKTSLPELSRYDALKYIGDAIGWFIQWPLSLVKLSRSTEATSQNPALTQPAQDNSCYRPELEVPIEQDQSHECYHIDATMIESFGDEFLFGAHDVSTQHDVDGSEEELDEMHEQPQAPTLSKLEQDIKTALWNIENLRPQSMISLATRLTKHYDSDMSIEIN